MNAQPTLLWLAAGLYGLGLLFAVWRLAGARPYRFWPKLAIVLPAFLLHTAFLWSHGLAQGRCPVATLFETLVFIAWCMVGLHLVFSLVLRMNFLTAFSMPLVLLALLAAFAVGDGVAARSGARGIWLGAHAAVDVLAFAALALSGVASLMYLVQEFQLRRHRLSISFMLMPPMMRLESLAAWLLVGGFLLYTAGLAGGIVALAVEKTAHQRGDAKVVWAAGVWFYYFVLSGGWLAGKLSGRRFAWLCLGGAIFILATFALANAWSGFHRFVA
ncbi:MAG: cytochrome C assembly family protein [Verrucomicrobiia bacterium]|jgi:ABC-type uncharacterized transport system permease subunit